VAGCYEHGNELLGSIKGGANPLEHLSHCSLLKAAFAPWRQLVTQYSVSVGFSLNFLPDGSSYLDLGRFLCTTGCVSRRSSG
jgi:hypothetical protein